MPRCGSRVRTAPRPCRAVTGVERVGQAQAEFAGGGFGGEQVAPLDPCWNTACVECSPTKFAYAVVPTTSNRRYLVA